MIRNSETTLRPTVLTGNIGDDELWESPIEEDALARG
jgi:hypothetical protein